MPKADVSESLISRVEKLEKTLFGKKLEQFISKEKKGPKPLFEDQLEKVLFFILLERVLEGKIAVTSALLAEMTEKTKNTLNIRLERLYFKRLIQKQQIGNAVLYYIPLQELLLEAVTKELIKMKKTYDETVKDTPEKKLEKEIMLKYIMDGNLILARVKHYFDSIENKGTITTLDLKQDFKD